MLVIYVVSVVIAYLIYTVIKLKIQDRAEDLRMSRLSLKKRQNRNVFQGKQEESNEYGEVTLISDDDSDAAKGFTAEYMHRLDPVPHGGESSTSKVQEDATDALMKTTTNHGEPGLSVYDVSTDPLSSDEEDEPPVINANAKQALFSWTHKGPSKSSVLEGKKSNPVFIDSDSSEESDNKNKKPRRFRGRPRGAKKNYAAFQDLEDTGIFKENKMSENIRPEVVIQREITIAGCKVKLPIKPYPCQIAVMNMVIQGCTKEQNCLLESPTGSGKTLALLCGVLAWQEHYAAELYKEHISEPNNDPACCANATDFLPGCGAEPNDFCDSLPNDEDSELFEKKRKKLVVPKIYYGTRTHRQIEQIIREFRKTVYRDKKMTILSSREHTCIQDTERSKTDLCHELLDHAKHIGCQFYSEKNKKTIANHDRLTSLGLEPAWNIEELVDIGRSHGACPYFAARNLMAEADIIFCPYNYLIDPDIRDRMQINLKNQIIVLDEAHNIEDICRDVASVSFRGDHLNAVALESAGLAKKRARDSNVYGTLTSYILDLEKLMKTVGIEQTDRLSNNLSSPYWTGPELAELFNINGIGSSRYPSFLAAGKAALEDYDKAREEGSQTKTPTISQSAEPTLKHLLYLIQVISTEKLINDYRACVIESVEKGVRYAEDGAWYSTRNQEHRVRTLKLICMNSAVIFSPLSESARAILLASGTLTPTTSFQSELGTRFPHVLSANHVIPKDQVYVTCIPRGPNGVSLRATYQNVNTWNFQDDLGRLLIDVCQSVPHGVLCFFSSYQVMNSQISRWKMNRIWDELETFKAIFLEPRYGGDLSQIMQEYRDVLRETVDASHSGINGALLFAVFRGKVAEGIDFSDNEARCVLTIGIPYAVRKDPVVDMKYKYNDMNTSKGFLNGSEWYTVQAFRALNQALGRCVRHRHDWGAVLLVDERFQMQQNKNYLPKWIKAMWIEQKRYNIKEELRNFVSKQKSREAKNMIDC